MKRKFLRMLTGVAVMLLASIALIACPVASAWGNEPITLETSTTNWTDGNTYYAVGGTGIAVEDQFQLDNRVEVSGQVTLRLKDGCFLYAGGGIHIQNGATLTIEGESTDPDAMGRLEVHGSSHAGIGSSEYENDNNGRLVINGGRIDARTSYGTNALGCGKNSAKFGAVVINGGYIENALGDSGGCGIGGAGCGEVIITGGYIRNATGWYGGGAAIRAAKVTVSGGVMCATAGKAQSGNKTIESNTFTTGENGNAVIFTDKGIKDMSSSTSWSGIVFQDNSGKMYGSSVTPTESFEIASGQSLTIENGQTLTIASGKKLAVDGTLAINGALYLSEGASLSGYQASAILLQLNGGAVGGKNLNKIYATSIAASGLQVSKTGYTFGGWFDNDQCTGDAVETLTPDTNADKTYYAKWNPISYPISYELDGGVNDGNNPSSYTIEDAVSLQAATKTGYTFQGWFDDSDNKVEFIAQCSTGEKKLTAKWTPNTYTVHFDANRGKGTMADQTFTYDANAEALSANAFTRSCYFFTGWKDEASGKTYANGEQVQNLTASANGVVTLKAQWTYIPQPVSIKFVTGCEDNIEPLRGTESYSIENRVLPTVTKAGYFFEGWYVSDAFKGEALGQLPASFPYGGATYYAKWNPITYTVHFDANGGEGTMEDQTFAYDAVQALSTSVFSKAGYVFAGWKDPSTGKTYADAQELPNLTTTDGVVFTFEAQWNPVAYTVHFDANGGEGTMADQTFTYGDVQALDPCAFTKTGCKFAGWLDEATGKTYANSEKVQNLTAAADGNIILKALWTQTAVGDTVSVDTGSGRVSFTVVHAADESGKGGTLALVGCSACKGRLSIPASVEVDGVVYTVTIIKAGAFKGRAQLTKVVVPSSITKIGEEAFKDCKKLKSVVIGKNVKTIGAGAFKGCKNLKTVTICSKKLSKKSVKNCLKGSKAIKVVVKVGSVKANKTYATKYAKLFTKKISGKKVKVLASKKALK